MSLNESFIQEVSDEVRRDRLFNLFRKYGWIGVCLILLLVGGAGINEWRKNKERVTAEQNGDELRDDINEHQKLTGLKRINVVRSQIPAVTHIDFSARVQTVDKDINPKYHQLISKFEEKTGCPLIVNTSFNVRGEPIVCTPEDSYRCFMRTELDLLIINNFLLLKKNQPEFKDNIKWKEA